MTRSLTFAAAVLACALIGAGCDETAAPPAKPPQTSAPARATSPPAIPGVDENDSASDTVLVNHGPRRQPDRYQQDETMASGILRIICRIPGVRVSLPPRKPIDFKGPTAIRNPMTVDPYRVIYDGIRVRGYDIKNELEYYQKWNPPVVETPLNWLAYPRRGGGPLGVNGVAIIVEGIRAGAREELGRAGAFVSHKGAHYIRGRGNHGGYNLVFVPPHEKVIFASDDHFPCEIAITDHQTGEPLGKPFKARALPFVREGTYAGWIHRANPGSATQPRPIPAPSPTFRQKGVYVMRCLRHPWHVGYVIVVDNPYVAVSGARNPSFPSGSGKNTIDKLPPGTWKVKVWHPLVEPVKEIHEVEIETDETFHLVVEFKPPKELQDLAK